MKRTAAALLALTFAIASPVLAQGRGHGHDHDKGENKEAEHGKKGEHGEHGNSVIVRDEDGRERASRQVIVTNPVYTTSDARGSRGGGPAFCRSGAGHPVYGRSWCLQKGFGLGNSASRWNRATWSDVVLQPRRATIGDVLSSVVLGRLTNYAANTLGLRAPLAGTWLTNTPDRRVYIVRSGGTPVAEMVDTNRDGRADYVLLYR